IRPSTSRADQLRCRAVAQLSRMSRPESARLSDAALLPRIFATVGLLAAVCVAEFVACRHRAAVANLLWLYWCFGYVSVAGLAYFVRHWRWLQVCACLPCVCYVASYFLLEESPRWLMANGRNSEALRLSDRCFQSESHIKELFNTPVMLRKTLVLFLAWFAISLTYYGVSLDSGFVVASNAFVSTGAAPAYVAAWLLADRLGRRVPSMAMYIGLGACLALLNLPDRDSVIYTLIALTAKLLVTSAFSVLIHYTAEICPTSVRNAGLFACSAVGRAASVAAPFVVMNGGAGVSRLAASRRRRPCDRRRTAGDPRLPLMQSVQEANLVTPFEPICPNFSGRESQFLDLLKKRRDDIAVYFVGQGGSAVAIETPTLPHSWSQWSQPELEPEEAVNSPAPAAAAASEPGYDDDPAVFFSSSKYLINPFA
uniref:MFS domain-containing protein n=1 Tax=Macrostomum lignano TaxID=282301 RepID=A0A1I8FSL1_9PLAT